MSPVPHCSSVPLVMQVAPIHNLLSQHECCTSLLTHSFCSCEWKEALRTCSSLLEISINFFLTAKNMYIYSGLPMQAEIKYACFQPATKCASLEMLGATCALEENVILLLSVSEPSCASVRCNFCNSLHSANPVNNTCALRQNYCPGCSSHH